MPTTKSDVYTTQTLETGDNRADARLIAGKQRQATVSVTLVGDEDAADVIGLVDLPRGVLIDPVQSFVQCDDPGTTLTVDIGDVTTADGLADGIVLSAGGKVPFVAAVGDFPLVEVDGVVNLTVATAGTLTANAVLRVVIVYVNYL
jgi:hypothetical protein